MKKFMTRLFTRATPKGAADYPANMQDLRPGDPCWCGSGKRYRKCHRPEDRRREKELGINRSSKSICDAFT